MPTNKEPKEKRKKDDKEARFITNYLKPWLMHHLDINMVWEAKYVYDYEKRYNYKSDRSLANEIVVMKACGRKIVVKNSDASGYGTACDGYKIVNGQGYFFFMFQEHKNKKFFAINVGRLCAEIDSGAKSLSAIRAEEISDYVIIK